jgi:hypothetical protein
VATNDIGYINPGVTLRKFYKILLLLSPRNSLKNYRVHILFLDKKHLPYILYHQQLKNNPNLKPTFLSEIIAIHIPGTYLSETLLTRCPMMNITFELISTLKERAYFTSFMKLKKTDVRKISDTGDQQ